MQKPFTFSRWFSIAAFTTIAGVSILTALLISRLLISDIVHRDAKVSMEFVQSITAVEHPEDYFTGGKAVDTRLLDFFNHVSQMPHVLRANVFSSDRRIIWSSDANLIGMTFSHNPELEAALLGHLKVSEDVRWKPEHIFFQMEEQEFMELYLPVVSMGKVIGVVEVYKDSQTLLQSINKGVRTVWLCSLAGAALMYAVLCWLVRWADRRIQAQHAEQLEAATLAAMAAVATAVAQGPIAAIRSRAASGLESSSHVSREANEEILFEAERLQRWLRDLLEYAPQQSADGSNSVPAALFDGMPALEAAR
jgi:hypothetical protein